MVGTSARMMMEYMEDKFALKSQAMKGGEYYLGPGAALDQVMDGLEAGVQQYYSKGPGEQHAGLQRASPCGDGGRREAPIAIPRSNIHIYNEVILYLDIPRSNYRLYCT